MDRLLEDYQRQQAGQISKAMIQQSEAHEQRLQAGWQEKWRKAHQHLTALLQCLDQDYDEACEKSNRPLDAFTDDDLAHLIHLRLQMLLDAGRGRGKADEIITLRRQMEEMKNQMIQLEKVNGDLQQSKQILEAEVARLQAHASALQQVCKPTSSGVEKPAEAASSPIWVDAWRETRNYEKTAMIVRAMGETGKALRPSILREAARRLCLSPDNGALDEALNRLLSGDEQIFPPLIDRILDLSGQGFSAGGNPPDILRLTTVGREAFQVMTDQVPRKNEYDRLLKKHTSPEHTILNIQAAEVLEEAGYLIWSQAQEIQLSDGGTFTPDILAVDPQTGEVVFIEVERDVHKDQAERKQKWLHLFQISNGNLYVFCDNLSCQRSIQGEINLALGRLVYNSYLTNLHGIRNGKRQDKDGSIWLSVRKGK